MNTAGEGRGEGGLPGRTLPPRWLRPTEAEAVTAPALGLQGGHVHGPRRHQGAQGGAGRGRRDSLSGVEAQVRALASL